MGDSIQLKKAADSANGMGSNAEMIKAALNQACDVAENDIATGVGVWDGQSAAEFKNSFIAAVQDVKALCDEAILLANNIKTAVENMAKADGAVGNSMGTSSRGAGPNAAYTVMK